MKTGQTPGGFAVIKPLQKDLLHMLSLINIEIYKTKQNDVNINNIINLKLKLLIHQICSFFCVLSIKYILFSGLYNVSMNTCKLGLVCKFNHIFSIFK